MRLFLKSPYFTLFQTPNLENFENVDEKKSFLHTFLDSKLREILKMLMKKVMRKNVHISHLFELQTWGNFEKIDEKKVHISHFFELQTWGNFEKRDEKKRPYFTLFRAPDSSF